MGTASNINEHDSFSNVLKYYRQNVPGFQQKSIFEVLDTFSEKDWAPIDTWIQNQFKHRVVKDPTLSTAYRKQGNLFYARKNLKKSIEYYTKSLCYGLPASEEYSLALGNRSAVTFERGNYLDCLEDIDLCLNSNYPENLRPKLLVRKAETLHKLGRLDALVLFLEEANSLFRNVSCKDEDKYISKLNQLKDIKVKDSAECDTASDYIYKLPIFENGENADFAYASSQIEVRYTALKGRHVVAKENIKMGEILFLEKAFAFASIFDVKTQHMSHEKCYQCLKNVCHGIPCNSCVQCIFCDSTCRDLSWEESHKWECIGMQTNMWYHLGIALPALKTFLKGTSSGFHEIYGDVVERKNHFGSKTNNYPYFDSLIYHVRENDLETAICAATVVRYLKKYTDFFPWCLSLPNCPMKDITSLTKYVANRLAKHILQMENNSSLIEHWVDEETDIGLPIQKEPVACGIFPSVSMMNHSCKPNVTNYFICDTIVVKAVEDIRKEEEIFNCYGIDYRTMGKEERQKHCFSLYNFECRCIICSNPEAEMEMFDTFICTKCGQGVPDNKLKFYHCQHCDTQIDINQLKEVNEKASELLEDENNEVALLSCLHRRKRILSEKHIDLQETYYKLYQFYAKTADIQTMIKYFEKWIENEKSRIGEYAQKLGLILYEIGLLVKQNLKRKHSSESNKDLCSKAELILKEAKIICSLYYPEYFIARVRCI